jgi:hypothetical protein
MPVRILIVSVLAALAVVATPVAAQASTCSVGNSGVTFDRYGGAARFKSLTTQAGMNCASARYVLNSWLRRSYARTGRLPYSFYDGYVTWYCSKLSNLRWECDEYDSGTRFRFTAFRI